VTCIVQIGDIHASPGPRNADRYAALDQIITEASGLDRLGAFAIPGDLFDALSTTDDRNALDTRLQRMAGLAPVVICYGNHDRDGDLDGFARLGSRWPILVVDRPQCVRLALATGITATIFALPYPNKARLVSAGVAVGDVVDVAGDLLEPIFMAAAVTLADARARGDRTLMIGHINIAGAVASTGQPNIGHEIELSPRQLDRLGPIPKLLNHIHRPQQLAGAYYAGSICRMDYGEIEDKSYLVLTLEDVDDPVEEASAWSIARRPLAIPPMFHVEGRLTRERFALAETCVAEARRRYDEDDWTGCDVRVRYTYAASERAVLDEAPLRARFATALRVKIEGVAVPDRTLRAPTVAAATTLRDKLAAYLGVDALPADVAHKLDRLVSLDSAVLIARVGDEIAAIEAGTPAEVAA